MATTTIIAHVKDGVITPDEPIRLPEGAEVRLEIDAWLGVGDESRSHIIDILERNRPPGLFKTSAEVDAYIENERNSWE